MNRCLAININNKRCRAKTENNQLFCCEKHKPINKEIINEGCFMCMEKINKSNELLYLKCRHAFHRDCYIEWLNYSTYEEPVCIICRRIAFSKKDYEKQKTSKIKRFTDTKKIDSINYILNHPIYYMPHTPPGSPPPL